MEIIFLLIGFSLCVAIFFLVAFIWAIRTDQYEDEYGDSIRLLHDDTTPPDNQHTS
ncbi:MAG: cbb3-type cytochrome oxidase assembly protein CcoS [Flavobacteriales bacterium]|nr:cbb3-type cytochrome oxidase assembly protein CcoS [Flavobacteriales bacterium]